MPYDYSFDQFDPTVLRQQSIFGGMGSNPFPTNPFGSGQSDNPFQTNPFPSQQVQAAPPQPPGMNPDDDINLEMQRRISLMNQFFPERNQASNRFNDLVNNAPQMNHPGLGARIGAGLASLGQYNKQTGMYSGGGPDVANKILYAPYLRDLTEWKEKIGPAQQAATLENTSNNINRQAGATMVTAETAAARARAQEKTAAAKQQSTDEYNRERIRIQDAKLEMQTAKQQMPNMQYRVGADGYVYGYDKNSKSPPWNTGVKETDLSPREKMFYGIASALALQGVRGQNAIDVKKTPPGEANSSETGKEFTDRQQMAWKRMWDQGDRDWLDKDETGFLSLKDKPVESEGYGIGDWGVVTKRDVEAWQRAYDAGYPARPQAPAQAPAQTPIVPPPPGPGNGQGIQPSPNVRMPTPAASHPTAPPAAAPQGSGQFKMPGLPPPSGASTGQIGQFPGLFNIGETNQANMGPNIPTQVSPNAPTKGTRVGDADMQQIQQEQEQGVQAGQLAVVQGPDGKHYTIPAANVEKMLADPRYAGFRRVK